MRKILIGTCALFIAAATLGAPVAANAATSKHKPHRAKPCVTRAEYRTVHVGMTLPQVKARFGVAGHQTSRSESTSTEWVGTGQYDADGFEIEHEREVTSVDLYREYPKCKSWKGWNRVVSINFDNYSTARDCGCTASLRERYLRWSAAVPRGTGGAWRSQTHAFSS